MSISRKDFLPVSVIMDFNGVGSHSLMSVFHRTPDPKRPALQLHQLITKDEEAFLIPDPL